MNLKKLIIEGLQDEVEVVPATREAIIQLSKKHYLHTIPARVKRIYVVRYKYPHGQQKMAIGMAIYGLPMYSASKFLSPEAMSGEVLDLKRLYLADVGIPNLESYVIAQTLKLLKQDEPNVKVVITNANEKAGHIGTVYQATNAIYLGKSKTGFHKYAYILRGNIKALRNKLPPKLYPKRIK
jgi:hypothetical protein